MKNSLNISVLLCISSLSISLYLHAQVPDSVIITKISDEIFMNGDVYKNVEYLSKKIGSRLSGSAGAEKAVQWTFDLMKNYGFDTVYKQEVMVPHWVRGDKEVAKVISPSLKGPRSVAITALGGSVATAKEGITAQVIEVKDFEELKKLGKEKIQGKIVFYNHPFDLRMIIPFEMYEEAGRYRFIGPSEAARYGAVAAVVRSMTNYIEDYPHTGATMYKDSLPKIPACAISTKDADWLSDVLKKDGQSKMYLRMNCQTLPDVMSYNVIGELRGSEHPEEIIDVGGHLDSWDLAEGANDDATGVMQSVEVLRTLKKIGVKPKRTIRAIMFMNEENGSRGGKEYANQVKIKGERHILALESDAGGFTPRGFNLEMPADKKAKIVAWEKYFHPYGVWEFKDGGGGVDIGPLRKQGVPLMDLSPDNQRYFIIHHSPKDVFELVNKRELELGSIVMTMMIYLVSEHGL